MVQQLLPENVQDGVTKADAAFFNGAFGKINDNFTELYGMGGGGGGSGSDWRVVPPDVDADAINTAIMDQWLAGGGMVYLSGDSYDLDKPIHVNPLFTHSGTAQAGTSNTITLANTAATNNFDYYFGVIKITGGTGSGQVRVITAYNSDTKVATVRTNWVTPPDVTSTYTIQYHSSALRTIDVRGNSCNATRLRAASGFTDDSFDGHSFVVRLESGINNRAGVVSDLTIDAQSNAQFCLYNRGIVERHFERINMQGATIAPYVMDASQNCHHTDVRCMGGQYSHFVLNGAASYSFERCEFTNCTVDTTLYKADDTFVGYNWYPGVHYPLMGKYDTCLMEIPQAGASSMVPLRILAGVSIRFDHCTFATAYTTGTASEGCVVLGDGSGSQPIENIGFYSCQFYRGGDVASGDYIVINDDVTGTVVEDGRFTGGYSGGNVAIRASAPVSVRGWTFRDSPKSFVDEGDGSNIHLLPAFSQWDNASRPDAGDGVILPGFNRDSGKMEYYDGTTWQEIGAGGGGGATNLAVSLSASQVVITSDTGTDATIPAVDGTNAGVMTPMMKAALDDAVPDTRTINGHDLSSNVTLTPDDLDDTSSTNKFASAAELSKLAGIEAGATANSSDAVLLNRANHTGSQSSSTISDLDEAVQDIVANMLQEGSNVTLTYDDGNGTLTIASTGGGGGTGTNLSASLSSSQVVIESDTGSDATIPAVDSTNAGVMTPAMKAALDDSVPDSRTINGHALSSNVTLTPDDLDDTSSTNKFTSAEDLTKLGGIEAGATANSDEDAAATANTLALRNSHGNLAANRFLNNVVPVVADGSTYIASMSLGSVYVVTSGSTFSAVRLPTTDVPQGCPWTVVNNSTAVVVVQASNGNSIQSVLPGDTLTVMSLQASPSTPAHWVKLSDKNKVDGVVNGVATSLTLWTGTQAQYDAIGTKDANTVYVVTE